MRTPPLLLGLTVLFWGWQAQLLWVGLVAGAALEIPNLRHARWEFTQADLDRVWNLCVALFLGATIYAFLSSDNLTAMSQLLQDNSNSNRLATLNQSKRSLFQLLQWLPVMFLPMALAQAYAAQPRFDLSTFSWWLRRKRTEPGFAQRYPTGLNLSYPYFACCLFAASAGNQRSLWFSAGLIVLVVWALWGNRSANFRSVTWFSSLVLALGLGLTVQLGLFQLQKLIQRLDEVLLARWTGSRNFDAKENQTRIGAIGRMKLSGRVVLRMTAPGAPPALLREASYNLFRAPLWSASHRQFERVTPEVNQSSWILNEASPPSHPATLAGYLPGGTGLLALPIGVSRLDQLPALGLATNLFGSARVEDGPGFVQFDLSYAPEHSMDSAPTRDDLEIPVTERAALSTLAERLKLGQLPPRQALQAVERFFADNFTYSTWQGPDHVARPGTTALSRFLLENRAGHCEYFATATTLLLRAANIPTRYAAGYSVQEKKGLYYVIRERHGHAWCLAFIDQAWRDVDTTPASWAKAESARASFWEPVADFGSRLWFEFSKWRWGHAAWKRYLLWLIVPLLGITLGRVLLQRQWGRSRGLARDATPPAWPGLDSEFYAVERRLAHSGFPRHSGEATAAWLARIRRAGTVSTEPLERLLACHYRLRFHPLGLSDRERSEFRQEINRWLQGDASRPA